MSMYLIVVQSVMDDHDGDGGGDDGVAAITDVDFAAHTRF